MPSHIRRPFEEQIAVSAIADPKPIRPCFLSSAQHDEFEILVRLVTLGLSGCALSRAWNVAKDLAGLSYDAYAILRGAHGGHEPLAEARLRSSV